MSLHKLIHKNYRNYQRFKSKRANHGDHQSSLRPLQFYILLIQYPFKCSPPSPLIHPLTGSPCMNISCTLTELEYADSSSRSRLPAPP